MSAKPTLIAPYGCECHIGTYWGSRGEKGTEYVVDKPCRDHGHAWITREARSIAVSRLFANVPGGGMV